MTSKGVSKVLDKYGKQIKAAIRKKLKADGTYATGDTYYSVDYKVKDGELDIYGSGVLDSLNRGLRPNETFPKINNIVKWMKAKGIQPRTLKKGRAGQFVKRTRSNYRSNAFVIARAINREGTIKGKNYKGTGILDYVLNRTVKSKMGKEILKAYSNDVREEMLTKFRANGFTDK